MREIQTVGVVGAGAMGRGIVQLFAQAGFKVLCYDAASAAVDDALEFVTTMINKSVARGRLPESVLESLSQNLSSADSLNDLSSCDLVIEAIVEDVTIKQGLFKQLEAIVDPQAILASNTSSLVIAEIASQCEYPNRVAGLHFFNPVPLMKVVEIISAVKTDVAVVSYLQTAVNKTGHRAVITADQPGFLVNHAGRGLYTEGLRVVEEQVATAYEVDAILKGALGFKMGPFELMDLTGLDVSGKVMESIYRQFNEEPRFRPSSLVPPRIAAGLYGRKTGEGWYRYQDGKKIEPELLVRLRPDTALTIWVDTNADDCVAIKSLIASQGLALASDSNHADMLVIQPWGTDATHAASAASLDCKKVIAIDPLPGFDRHRTLMQTPITDPAVSQAAVWLFSADGVEATLINDSPGFVSQRVLATIVNIAANIAQRGIASVEDLEDAVRLGLGYPSGPLSLGDQVGAGKVLEILQRQQALIGDDRYRPSLWLARRAALGVSLLTEEAPRS